MICGYTPKVVNRQHSTSMMNGLVIISLLLTIFTNLCEGLTPTFVKILPPWRKKYNQLNTGISCTFKSTLPINVTWYKNNVLLRKNRRISIYLNQAKKSGYIYIRKLVASDSGNYTCVGSNKDGVGGSGTSQLQVIAPFPPKLLPNKPPSEVTLYEGQEHEIECKADAYPIVDKYSWGMKSGDIDNMPNVQIKRSFILVFSYANPSEAGEYYCIAENNQGRTHGKTVVSVVGNPSWKTRPANVTVKAGENFKLSASFYGSETSLKVIWYLNNAKQNEKFVWKKNGSILTTEYEIKNAQIQSNGRYMLEVRNFNSKITAEVNVVVYSVPEVVIAEGRELSATEGESIHITCEVQGYPPPSVSWHSEGRLLGKTLVPSKTDMRRIKSSLVYSITAVKGVELYKCIGENDKGKDTEVIKVTTKGAPNKNGKEEEIDKMPIIISVVSGIIVLIVIFVSVYIVCYRKKRDETSPQLTRNSVVYRHTSDRIEEEANDEEQLITGPHYVAPLNHTPVLPPHRNRGKSVGRMSIKRQNTTNNGLKGKITDLENQYAVILPIGQGRLLDFADLNLGEVCGTGQFGIVTRGTLEEAACPSREIAVKMLKDNAGLSERKMMLDELNVMKSLSHHPNVVSLIGWCITEDNVYIVEEFVPNGSLLHHLRTERGFLQSHYVNVDQLANPGAGNEFLSFAWQVAAGMKYLSSLSIIHRDLAARNILLAHENVCKISDFGLARQIYQNSNYQKTSGGELPVRWMAPESLFNGNYTTASDVWSFGILLWEIATLGDIPYPDVPGIERLIKDLKQGKRMDKPVSCSEQLFQLITRCWEEIPARRPNFVILTQQLGNMLIDKTPHLDFSALVKYLDEMQQDAEDLDVPVGAMAGNNSSIGFNSLAI